MWNNEVKKNDITILYVEDEELIRTEVGAMLEIVAKKVILACDGQEGLEKFKSNSIDIVISDINMPRKNGFDMLKDIREINYNMPAIILSAYSQNDFLKEAMKIDLINQYLLKPVNILELFEKINQNVKRINQKKELIETKKLLSQYKSIVDEVAIVSKTNTKGEITYVNDYFCEISGYSEGELLGKSHNIVRHEDNSKELYEDLWKTIKDDKVTWTGKIKNKTKDGSFYMVEAHISPILDENGNTNEFIAVRKDITELEAYQNILQDKLSNSNEDLRHTVHLISEYEKAINLATSVIRFDKNFKINFVNNSFLNISKSSNEKLINTNFHERFVKELNSSQKEIKNKILSKNIYEGVLDCKKDDGEIFHMDFTFVPILDESDNVIEYMAMGTDITDVINLHKEIDNTQKDVIFTLGSIGESRSKETGNHVIRVAEYSYLLAIKIGLSEDDAQLIKMASPMHDIGKVGIPDSILKKAGKLTVEEMEIMKDHTLYGYEMLKNSSRKILQTSALVAYEHHEKWDGTGYPRGLKGEEINIFGRITAVADVFDALGSDRCYKKAWPLNDILDLLRNNSEKHFDPRIVNAFIENLDDFLRIRDRYADKF
jgi:PAS domain S-box-containing protein